MRHKPEAPHTTPPVLLDYQALWTFYGLHKSTISKMVMLGTFVPTVKVGNKNYFKRDAVEQKIEAWTEDY